MSFISPCCITLSRISSAILQKTQGVRTLLRCFRRNYSSLAVMDAAIYIAVGARYQGRLFPAIPVLLRVFNMN